eukprot:CAMPEP_0174287032 /NCGR_PEP_ID=MMETSP0809-20121228/14141_1 /TAXON_ID=73025 ORGANISM="Eutreptiella gymnastica-like, Strain CCMP1594" /NCGR_SAMPLE_ID=MMETSP0809 /ASSEMBLY_ACC=CAM_ASM_000658 /LENGTH=91 /DNA_ID=CAMNT_0015383365 /DNA_START=336 /DNA_END=612 /DNA_ORIENTATION=-
MTCARHTTDLLHTIPAAHMDIISSTATTGRDRTMQRFPVAPAAHSRQCAAMEGYGNQYQVSLPDSESLPEPFTKRPLRGGHIPGATSGTTL